MSCGSGEVAHVVGHVTAWVRPSRRSKVEGAATSDRRTRNGTNASAAVAGAGDGTASGRVSTSDTSTVVDGGVAIDDDVDGSVGSVVGTGGAVASAATEPDEPTPGV